MSYKSILLHVNESRHALARMQLTTRLAHTCGAHLIGMATTTLPGAFYIPGVFGESNVTLNAYLQLLREQAKTALAEFEAVARKLEVGSFECQMIEDEAGNALSMLGRYSDLVVVGQIDPDETLPSLRRDLPQYVLLHCGRPILIVPYKEQAGTLGKRIVIAWDGSKEASHAVTGAMPLLADANAVQIASFRTRTELDTDLQDDPGPQLARYLERHGIRAELMEETTPAGMNVGDALIADVRDFNADLLVMGGYGHSRFREVLLGGVTRTVLSSMPVSTLMFH